ncbi:MAG: hypothetical protein F6K19_42370 [Cyanothece sp. SIO1E1]|nr:hypothetical protein [Cyanothece sp. SIO1E1]
MTSKTAAGQNPQSVLASRTMKIGGIITILASLLDFLVLMLPPNFLDRQWQLGFTTQLVDRGIVPLVGLALLFAGLWVEANSGKAPKSQNSLTSLKFWALIISSILGFLFLILALLHPNNVRINSQEALERVSQQATEAESQLETRLNSEVTQQRGQIDALIQDPNLLNQAIQSGQVPQEQAGLFQQFKNDPQALNQFLDERAGQFRQRIQTEIGTRREGAERQIKTEAWKSGLRISIGSLLLATAYIIIGWSGLRGI